MTDEPQNNDPKSKDSSFSTSDIFKNRAANEKEDQIRERLEKTTGDGYVKEDLKDIPDELENITDKMIRLVHHRSKRDQIDSWDMIFYALDEAGFQHSAYFSQKLHRELLREFGYKDKYLRRPRKDKNPPIRRDALSFIFKKMDWEYDQVSLKTARQREWLEVRAGLREPLERDRRDDRKKKRKKPGGCLFWGFVIFVIILIIS